MVESVTFVFSALTVCAEIFILAVLAASIFDGPQGRRLLAFVRKRGEHAALAVALAAIVGSLFYSEIAGFPPCVLCVFQRVLMYPQAAFLGIALWHPKKTYHDAALIFSVIGAAVAGYGQYLQFGGESLIPCGADSASCSRRFFIEFGHVTIPMMSFVAFLLIIVLLFPQRFSQRDI